MKLKNGNILVGCQSSNDNSLIEYKYDNYNLIKIKSKDKAYSKSITGLLELKDEVIISCSCDCSIKFWIE